MCDYKVLYYDDRGHVVECAQCGHLKVAFGTTALSLTKDHFFEFLQMIMDRYEKQWECQHPDRKTVIIPTTVPSVALLYSINELKALIEMLENAVTALEIDAMTGVE